MKFIDDMTELALPLIEESGCELVDAEYKKEGSVMVLRFYVELNEGHISIDELAEVSEKISRAIDERDDIRDNFTLEVSSPGVERVLKKPKDYERFAGSRVDVSLYRARDGAKKLVAVLEGYEDGVFTFTDANGTFELAESEVAKINLHFDFKF
ncbi:MAG: ribosome maturation factor RimP [Eubacteriaceae bacterium]|nr:ribosome maturation factor RimP [Eubacteriaceae bacterium]